MEPEIVECHRQRVIEFILFMIVRPQGIVRLKFVMRFIAFNCYIADRRYEQQVVSCVHDTLARVNVGPRQVSAAPDDEQIGIKLCLSPNAPSDGSTLTG